MFYTENDYHNNLYDSFEEIFIPNLFTEFHFQLIFIHLVHTEKQYPRPLIS